MTAVACGSPLVLPGSRMNVPIPSGLLGCNCVRTIVEEPGQRGNETRMSQGAAFTDISEKSVNLD